MRKLSLITLGILAVLFGIGLYLYYTMGGFEKPIIKVKDSPAYTVLGKLHKGQVNSKEVGKLFAEADKLVSQKKLVGETAAILITHPDSMKNSEMFIGVLVKDTTQALPLGYSKRTVPSRKVVEAYIKNYQTAPFVYPDIQEYADSAKITISMVGCVERYMPSNEAYFEVPVK